MIVQWLTPLIMFIFAGAFIVARNVDRVRLSAYEFPVSYALAGLAFAAEVALGDAESTRMLEARMFADQFYTLSVAVFAAALYKRRQRPVPVMSIAFVALATCAANLVFWNAADLYERTIATSVGISAILLTAVPALLPARRDVDKALLVLVPLLAFSISAIALMISPKAEFDTSTYIALVNLTVSALGIAIALTLLFEAFSGRHRALERQVLTDPLTGVLNRRGFEQIARRACARCSARGETVAFIILDIDHFKAVNDAYGHPVGDAVLKRFAQLVRDSLGPSEVVGRIGGEEFAIIVPDCNVAIATLAAEDLRARVAAMDFGDIGPALAVTATFGVVEAMDGFDAAFAAADALLLQGKRTGRNQVVAPPPNPPLHKAA